MENSFLPTAMVLKEQKVTFSDMISVIHHISRVSEQIRLISCIKVARRLDGWVFRRLVLTSQLVIHFI